MHRRGRRIADARPKTFLEKFHELLIIEKNDKLKGAPTELRSPDGKCENIHFRDLADPSKSVER